MSSIYEIVIKLTYDEYKYNILLKAKYNKQDIMYKWHTPIYAINEQQAIEKYLTRYAVDKCIPWVCGGTAENIHREVVCVNKNIVYSIKELQDKMDSGDFLDYCRDKLGLTQTIDSILK